MESAAEQLLIAKWILRSLAYKYGVRVSFAPKITLGKAGSVWYGLLMVVPAIAVPQSIARVHRRASVEAIVGNAPEEPNAAAPPVEKPKEPGMPEIDIAQFQTFIDFSVQTGTLPEKIDVTKYIQKF